MPQQRMTDLDLGSVPSSVMFLRGYLVFLLFIAIEATAVSGNVTKYGHHRNRRQTSRTFCPPLKSFDTIVTCVLRGEEVACNRNVQPGTTAKVKCKRYYKPTGNPDYSRLTCLDSGEWDNTLFSCTPECGSSNLQGMSMVLNRIIDGEEANLGTFPWHAGLYYRQEYKERITWEQRCSGSLITDEFVITGAHCVKNTVENDLRVALGKYYRDWDKTERGEAKRTVARIIYQRDFSQKTFTFDIALLQLDEKVNFGGNIMPVCRGFPSGSTYLENNDLYVVGWGRTREGDPNSASDTLQYNTVSVVSQDICRKNAPSVYPTFDKFCTVKDDYPSIVQAGDSGGGITAVYDGLHFILGAVSARANQYSIFTNFTWPYNVIWIERQIRKYDRNFRWDENDVSELNNNERGCLLPLASSSRKFCSLAAGCEACDIYDRLCFIPPGSKVDRVKVVCAPGYTLRSPYSGGDVAICLNGQWYPGIPECLRYQYIPGDPWNEVTWQEARDHCVDKGMLLATIKSEDEDKSFKKAVAKQFTTTGVLPSAIWIGLSDVRIEETFEWVDGSILSESDFKTWLPREPSNNGDMEHCVEAKAGCGHRQNSYNWNDNYCTELRHYFCKEIIPSDRVIQRVSGAFRNSNPKGSPRYKYLPGYPWSKVTWEEARDNCLAKGTQLAIIRSDDQQRLFEESVAKHLKDTGTSPSNIWIGLREETISNPNNRDFKWVDGSVYKASWSCSFSNWLPGEPGKTTHVEECAVAVGDSTLNIFWSNGIIYKWNDADCKNKYHYFCSLKL